MKKKFSVLLSRVVHMCHFSLHEDDQSVKLKAIISLFTCLDILCSGLAKKFPTLKKNQTLKKLLTIKKVLST